MALLSVKMHWKFVEPRETIILEICMTVESNSAPEASSVGLSLQKHHNRQYTMVLTSKRTIFGIFHEQQTKIAYLEQISLKNIQARRQNSLEESKDAHL